MAQNATFKDQTKMTGATKTVVTRVATAARAVMVMDRSTVTMAAKAVMVIKAIMALLLRVVTQTEALTCRVATALRKAHPAATMVSKDQVHSLVMAVLREDTIMVTKVV